MGIERVVIEKDFGFIEGWGGIDGVNTHYRPLEDYRPIEGDGGSSI